MPNFKIYRGNLHDVRQQIETHFKFVYEGGATAFQSGFDDQSSSSLSFDNATRTLTITPTGSSFDVYQKGTKYTKTAAESIQITDVEGLHFIYYDSGVLKVTNTFSSTIITTYAFVAAVYWDATNNEAVMVMDERHGREMDSATHLYLHDTVHAQYGTGLGLASMQTDGTGNAAADAQFTVNAGTIFDEDILHSIAASATPAQIPVLYRDGANGEWKLPTITDYPIITTGTGRAAYNQNTSGTTWQLTEISNNQYTLVHYFATGDIYNPIIGILGQDDYVSLSAARDGAATEITGLLFGGLEDLTFEFVAIATVIWQTSTGYSNAVKSRTRTTEDGEDYIDWRQIQITGTGSSGGGTTNFWTGSGNDIYNNNSGNVGIGTTSPSGKLAVSGADSETNSVKLTRDSTQGIKVWGESSGTYVKSFANVGKNLIFQQDTAAAITFQNPTGTERMRVHSDGNVGIGTTAPSALLDVSDGNIRISKSGTTATGNAQISFNMPDHPSQQWFAGWWVDYSQPLVSFWGGGCALDFDSGAMKFITNSDEEQARITSDGAVLVGHQTTSLEFGGIHVMGTDCNFPSESGETGNMLLLERNTGNCAMALHCGEDQIAQIKFFHSNNLGQPIAGPSIRYRSADSALCFDNPNNTERLRINSSGNAVFTGHIEAPAIDTSGGLISLTQNNSSATQGSMACGTNFHIDSRDDNSKVYLNWYGGSGGFIVGDGNAGQLGGINADYELTLRGLTAIRGADSWLRINQSAPFSSGTYFGTCVVRSDNFFQVGSSYVTRIGVGYTRVSMNSVHPASNLGYRGHVINILAGATITSGYAVSLLTDTTRPEISHADADDDRPVLGIAIGGGNAGAAIDVLVEGVIKLTGGQFSPTAGQYCYASATAGYITGTAPSTSGQWVKVIGFCLATDVIYVRPQFNWVKVA